MDDTVSAAIGSSLPVDGPTFLLPPPASVSAADVLHVNGAAYAEQIPLGLLVEFRTLSPDLQALPSGTQPDAAPTVSGYAAPMPDDAPPAIVAGALQT